MEYKTLLDEALEAWDYTRAGVVAELENMPADKMDFSPAPGARTVTELVLHIVASGQVMAGELSNPVGDFTRQGYPEHIREHAGLLPESASRDGLAELLRSTGEEGLHRIRDAGELAMLQHIRRFDGKLGTRLAWMNHGIAHEEHHRGQLAHWARAMGVVPALTKRIHGS
ncbi:MAG: DinB family protein [Gemmatimonadota bacterium]|jgi:uncharacterized damage-inducible protein DinB